MTKKNVFLTGASSGIGRALAVEYGRQGASVALAARRREELEATAAEVKKAGGDARVYPLDVADADAVKDAVRAAERDLGSLDVVIANAGIAVNGPLATGSWEDVARVLDVNIRGAFATLVAAVPILVAQQKGHLVGVSSLAGRRGLPYSGAYGASKAALTSFLETLRIELAPMGVRVTDVQPGFVATPMNEGEAFPMPFRWPVERAARHVVRRLERAPRVLAFPWQTAALTALGMAVPSWLWDPILRRAAGGSNTPKALDPK